jgi:hypothetical protein
MASTYTPIASITLGADAASATFTSIPQTYTDLVLVCLTRSTRAANAGDSMRIRFNSDTGTNYSTTVLQGSADGAESTRFTSATFAYMRIPAATATANVFGLSIWNIMNYANTTTNKTTLQKSTSVTDQVELDVSLWRNTAAITTIDISANNGNLLLGSTFNLYGIQAGNA